MKNSDFLAVGCGLNDCSCLASDFVVLVLSPRRRTVLVIVIESNRGNRDRFFFDHDRLDVYRTYIQASADCRDAEYAMRVK